MAESSRLPALTNEVVHLDSLVGNDPVWRAIVDIAAHMRTDEWVLIGGQMVAMHGMIAGMPPPRATTDIDIVANVMVRVGTLERCVGVLTAMKLEPTPPLSGGSLHRFVGERATVDLVVPDHLPKSALARIGGHTVTSVVGGQRALDRAGRVRAVIGGAEVEIMVPDMRGAIVLKARAAVADRRDAERHFADLAFLCSVVADPIELRGQLDTKERRSLHRVELPDDPLSPPWIFLDAAVRLNALETWRLFRQK